MTKQVWLLLLTMVIFCLILGVSGTRNLRAAPVLQRLTSHPATDVRPVWSPDEQHIAFQSNRNDSFSIWVMDADGQNQREVLPGDSDDRHPAWSPDGKQLAFDSEASGRREIWVVDSDGRNARQITSLKALSNFPSWSPDGSQIAFYVYQNGIMDLWTVNVDGSNPQPLTSELASERREQCTFACHQAAWSPDGQEIAFEGGDHHSIWMMDADGGNARQIVPGDENNHFPWFTSDGQLIYITEHINPSEAWTDAWLLDPDSGDATLILGQVRLQGPLVWSQDRSKVLFHSPRTGNFDIYLADLQDAGGRAALQALDAAVVPPSQHPGPDLEASDAAADEVAQPEGTKTEVSEPAAVEQDQPAEPEVTPQVAEAVEEETQPSASEAETAATGRFDAPIMLAVFGLVLLGVIGLIVLISAMRRKRSV